MKSLDSFRVYKFEPLLYAKGKIEAEKTLRRLSNQVEPILRARAWKVGFLKEMCPKTKCLYGLNINRGSKIMIRLRKKVEKGTKKRKLQQEFPCPQQGTIASLDNSFLPYHVILDTLLHELAHNQHSNHSAEFYDLWNELRNDCKRLLEKGVSGKNDMLLKPFSGIGQQLGGSKLPPMSQRLLPKKETVRELLREAAEKRFNDGKRFTNVEKNKSSTLNQFIDLIGTERPLEVVESNCCQHSSSNDIVIIDLTSDA